MLVDIIFYSVLISLSALSVVNSQKTSNFKRGLLVSVGVVCGTERHSPFLFHITLLFVLDSVYRSTETIINQSAVKPHMEHIWRVVFPHEYVAKLKLFFMSEGT